MLSWIPLGFSFSSTSHILVIKILRIVEALSRLSLFDLELLPESSSHSCVPSFSLFTQLARWLIYTPLLVTSIFALFTETLFTWSELIETSFRLIEFDSFFTLLRERGRGRERESERERFYNLERFYNNEILQKRWRLLTKSLTTVDLLQE